MAQRKTLSFKMVLAALFILVNVLFIWNTNASLASAPTTIHTTDLWRPHGDPDDHWDLATQYALAYQGQIDLKGILIDYPFAAPVMEQGKRKLGDPGDPDVISVAMMNMITTLAVPVTIGSGHPMKTDDIKPDVSIADHSGIDQLLMILKSSAQPVIIHITGSSRDVAIAGKKEPKLFAEKCKAIYLNAGWAYGTNWECNVNYDPAAFAAIFELPCPIYWMPCNMEYDSSKQAVISKGQFASEYSLKQKEVLPFLSPRIQNYFAYMYRDGLYQKEKKQHDIYWLSYLNSPVEHDVIDYHSQQIRGMWCTAGFIHAAGKTVTKDGKIVPLNQASEQAVFTFDPIEIEFKDPRNFTWKHSPTSNKRFIFHVKDQEHYEQAMTKAIKTLLQSLP